MSRTHDVTISAFDLDRLEAALAKAIRERDLAEAERVELAKQLRSEKEMHAACQNERDEWIARFHADEKLLKEVM